MNLCLERNSVTKIRRNFYLSKKIVDDPQMLLRPSLVQTHDAKELIDGRLGHVAGWPHQSIRYQHHLYLVPFVKIKRRELSCVVILYRASGQVAFQPSLVDHVLF